MNRHIVLTILRRKNPQDNSRIDALLDAELTQTRGLFNWDRHCFAIFDHDPAIDPPQAHSHLLTPFGEFWVKEPLASVQAQLMVGARL